MATATFQPGDVVQLKSGGPLCTVIEVDGFQRTTCVYFNTATGLFETFTTPQACLRGGIGRPELPEDANRLRTTSVAKSSLS